MSLTEVMESAFIAGNKDGGFTLGECIASDTATRLGVSNAPSAAMIQTLTDTARLILMPIRLHYGVPFSPLSVYRSFDLERAVCADAIADKRAKAKIAGTDPDAAEAAYLARKQHCKGTAADIRVPGVSPLALGRWVVDHSRIEFDQLIFEFYNPANPAKGWVHISRVISGTPRGEILWTPDGKNYYPGYPHA